MWYLLLLFILLFMSVREGFEDKPNKPIVTECNQRSTCQQCRNDGKSANGICYWCKDKGCQSPDDYYNSNTCSSDLAKC